MDLLGLDQHGIVWYQMATRTGIVFLAAIVMVRIAGRRTFGKHTPFDVVVGIILGGILSRAITGAAPFWESLISCTILVLLHRLLAMGIYQSKMVEKLVKGSTHILYENGKVNWKNMRRNSITEKDLLLSIHKDANVNTLEEVRMAYEEVSGEISIVKK